MKYGRHSLLIVLTMGSMSGCANMLGHNYYQAWQEHAYTIRAIQDSQNGYYSSYSSYVMTPVSPYTTNSQLMSHYSDSLQYAPNIYTNPNVVQPMQNGASSEAYGSVYPAEPYYHEPVNGTLVEAINTNYQPTSQPLTQPIHNTAQAYVYPNAQVYAPMNHTNNHSIGY
jgi:hypothetical protein